MNRLLLGKLFLLILVGGGHAWAFELAKTVVRYQNSRGAYASGVVIGPGALLSTGHSMGNATNGGIVVSEGQGRGARSTGVFVSNRIVGNTSAGRERFSHIGMTLEDVAVVIFEGNPFHSPAELISVQEYPELESRAQVAAYEKSHVPQSFSISYQGYYRPNVRSEREAQEYVNKFGSHSVLNFVAEGPNKKLGRTLGLGASGSPVFDNRDRVCGIYSHSEVILGIKYMRYLNVQTNSVQSLLEKAKQAHPSSF